MKNLLLENISREDLKKHLKQLYLFLQSELPKIDRSPRVFLRQDQNNADDFLGKTGYYDPEAEEIYLYITDRHGKDILRSFAHEIIHHEQKCSGFTSKLDLSKTQEADYAEKDEGLKEAERDAFERGNMLFRKWTDRLKSKKQKEKDIMNEEKLRNIINNLVKEVLSEKKKSKKKDPVKDAETTAREQARKHLKNFTGKDIDEQEAKENLEENIPYPELMVKQERALNEAFSKRDDIIFNELIKQFTK